MVCMGLRVLRDLRTKIVQPPRPSPPPQPRAHKIKPKRVPTIHEEGSWESQKSKLPSPKVNRYRLPTAYLWRVGRRKGSGPGNFGSLLGDFGVFQLYFPRMFLKFGYLFVPFAALWPGRGGRLGWPIPNRSRPFDPAQHSALVWGLVGPVA